MKSLLFLTNIGNGAPEEDILLSDFLRKDFEITMAHPKDCESLLNDCDGVIIRNVWPTHEYQKEWERMCGVLRKCGINTYNPLTGKGDLQGKDYLVELTRAGYPVVPTINNLEYIDRLPKTEYILIKPKHGGDGSGQEKLTRVELLSRQKFDGYVVQPFLEFASEPSFFFIDNKFHHAITMPNRILDRDISVYQPTAQELETAQRFVDWNGMAYGIQRIDFLKLHDGSILLTEIEDIAPYLYLLDIDEKTRESFMEKIKTSIQVAY